MGKGGLENQLKMQDSFHALIFCCELVYAIQGLLSFRIFAIENATKEKGRDKEESKRKEKRRREIEDFKYT